MRAIKTIIASAACAALIMTAISAIAQFNESSPGPVAIGVNAPGVVQLPTAAATQNTVTTTGPVSSETTISVGSVAAQALEWVATTFIGVIGTALTALILKWFKAAGIQISDGARARLQELVVNGLNASAKAAADEMKGRGQVEIRDATVAKTVAYVQAHGVDTFKQLGLEPTGQMAVEAIKARIETAVADPAAPTPAVMDVPTDQTRVPPPSKND